MTKKTEYVNIRVSKKVKAKWQRLAKKEGRTLSNWIAWQLDNFSVGRIEK